jgi:hypothetical protein
MLGLVYGDDYPRLLGWWWRFLRFLGGFGLGVYLFFILMALGILFLFAALANQKGNFSVTLSSELMDLDVELSTSEDFSAPKVRLLSDVLSEVNAYTIHDMPDNLDEGSGSHNMDDVMVYTFWVKNSGTQSVDMSWYLVLNASTKNVDKATWLMVYDEDGMLLYSEETDDGGREKIEGFTNQALYEQCKEPGQIFQSVDDGIYEVSPLPYQDNDIVTSADLPEFAPGEMRKYTVVIWVEGEDYDCDNSLVGGHAGYAFKFVTEGSEDEIFDSYGYDPDDTSQTLRDESKSPLSGLQKLRNK